jgi:hypothetical protein
MPRTSTLRAFALALVLASLWSWLAQLWSENGCIIDPGGRCSTAPTVPSTDNGCGIDPGGRCTSAPTVPSTDNGCGIDPWGRCTG